MGIRIKINRPIQGPRRLPAVERIAARRSSIIRRHVPEAADLVHPIDVTQAFGTEQLEVGPFLDYARTITAFGGILVYYKDQDRRFRHALWMVVAWSVVTSFEYWALTSYADGRGYLWVCPLLIGAVLNLLIVWKWPEVYRTIEIRPDCMILEGKDVFWVQNMPSDWPAFQRKNEKTHVLCGIYGTRFIEYITARQCHKHDRMPQVIAAHLQNAMMQLWQRPP